MKKRKLLSLALAFALVLTTAFAGAEGIFAGTVSDANGIQATEITAQSANSNEEITPYIAKMTTGSDNTAIVAVTATKKGTLAIPLAGVEVGKGVTVTLHSTSAATSGDRIGYSKYLSSSKVEDTLYAKVAKAGTYYLKFETASYSAGTPQSVGFGAILYPAGGTLTKGKVFYGASPDNSGVSYYKVTAPGNGYLTVSFPERLTDYSSFNIKLMNSRKNSLFTNFEYLSSSKAYKTTIGVAKGTYYIAVKNSDNAYGIKVSFTSVKESSGSSRSKAKSITKGSTKKGIITATQSESSGDWYKFKVTKTQYVKFTFKVKANGGGSSGGLKAAFYQSGKSYPATSVNCYGEDGKEVQLYTIGKGTKLAPGTYYIKVQKYSHGNGYYTLKWNK